MLGKFGICTSFLDMEPQGIRPLPPIWSYYYLIFMSASMLFCSKCIKDMIGSADPGSIPDIGKNFSNGKK
jgi:hypothetical protein